MRDATIPPTLEEHRLREHNGKLVAALVAAEKYLIGYQVEGTYNAVLKQIREAIANETS